MPEQPNRAICNIILFSTYLVGATVSILLFMRSSAEQAPLGHIIASGLPCLYVITTSLFLYLKRPQVAAHMLVMFYLLLACAISWYWGINVPIGQLVFAVTIVLAGLLLTPHHALLAALVASLVLMLLYLAGHFGWYQPEATWASQPNLGDVFTHSAVFGMLALASWLHNRRLARSLSQAQQAEAALQAQKAILKSRVKKRTEQLRQAQLKEMQQMYRFAEFGQLGVSLLHDLANHLTALTLEIEGLQNTEHSKAISRAQHITYYLGNIVHNTRERLNGVKQEHVFNVVDAVSRTVAFMRDKAEESNVTIEWQAPTQPLLFIGDEISLSQVIATITSNAIDALETAKSPQRLVVVKMQQNKTHLAIRISNVGKKIAQSQRRHLFKPFYSTKRTGMGLGLFMAKQTIEMQFSGTLTLNPKSIHTEFFITLPYKQEQA